MQEVVKVIEGVKVVPVELVHRLYSARGFRQVFEENLSQEKSYLKAYEEVETCYMQIFGIRRYTNYQSFVTSNPPRK